MLIRLMRWMRAGLVMVVATTTLAGCATSSATAVKGEAIKELPAGIVPDEVLGLKVSKEETSAVQGAKSAFVDSIGLYSLRSDDLLQATLQVSRFTKDAKVKSESFRTGVVQQIGSSTPQAVQMDGTTIYLTTGKRQTVAVWFQGRYLYILGTREEYATPRALLRELVTVKQ